MMRDLRNKPAPGLAASIPTEVRNAQALVADSSALITFEEPLNARTSQVREYIIKNVNTGREKSVTDSPAIITGLKNGTSYTFEIVASNSMGASPKVVTKPMTPRAAWSSQVIDADSDARSISSTTLNGRPVIAYVDSKTSVLRLATWSGKSWKKSTIDSDIKGQVSLCVSGRNLKQTLHVFYADKTDNDLRYATVTGVARDDLPDEGAWLYAETIRKVHELNPGTGVEMLAPDFGAQPELLNQVFETRPEVFAHNLETVPRIFKRIRPAFTYEKSLNVITQAREFGLITKSNLILGLGEDTSEIIQALEDLHNAGCDLITITQYLRPTNKHHPVERWVKPDEFVDLAKRAEDIGFSGVMSGPLVRSSYRAGRLYKQALEKRTQVAAENHG
jgi:hypothetical protein